MISIHTIVVSDFLQNSRIVFNTDSSEVLIVDPGAESGKIFEKFKSLVGTYSLSKVKIILTHLHIDHVGGVKGLIKLLHSEFNLEIELLFHPQAEVYRDSIEIQAKMFGVSPLDYQNVPEASAYLSEPDDFECSGIVFKVFDTPGHAEGHISLYAEIDGEFQCDGITYSCPLLIAGDALFEGSIGRTDLPGGNHELLLEMIKTKILTLPDNTLVLCGHGRNTKVGTERETNFYLKGI